ncbi:DUF1648 domain-containing protein [Micrococcales bacterium 31B]|nr:DUF1648 domain-containing protein [Micrococcales bacterium 31B]
MKTTVVTYAEPPQAQAAARFLALPALALVTTLVAWIVGGSDLPSQVAIHFSASGTADGFASPTVAFLVPLALQVGLTALLFGMARSFAFRPPMARLLAGTAGFLGALFALIALFVTLPQRGLATGQGFTSSPWLIALLLAAGAIVGVFAYFAAADSERIETESETLPRLETRPGTTLAFSTTVGFGPVFFALTAALMLLAIVAPWLLQAWPLAIVLGLVALLTLSLNSFTVSIGAQGLRCRSWMGFTVKHVPLDGLVGASAAVRTASELGGWGYRFTGSGSGISLGTGLTLLVHPARGQDWFCSMPEAQLAAATVNALVERRAQGASGSDPGAVPGTAPR